MTQASLPPQPEHDDEYFDQFENADEARTKVTQSQEEAEVAREESRESVADGQAIEQWLTTETETNLDTISFRGRAFEWKQPGVIHRRQTLKLLANSRPEEFEDVDPDDDEAVNEAIKEGFDPESVKSVVGLYDHQLTTLAELCTDDYMGDETVPEGDDLCLGAQRWGKFKLEDEEAADGSTIEGLSALARQVVADRLEVTDDEDEDGEGK